MLFAGAAIFGWLAFAPGEPAFAAIARVLFVGLAGLGVLTVAYRAFLERNEDRSAIRTSDRAREREPPGGSARRSRAA